MHLSRSFPVSLIGGIILAANLQAAPQRPRPDWAASLVPEARLLYRLEFVQMVTAIVSGDPPDAGFGWFHGCQTCYGWQWLAARYDANRDGAISRAEFTGPADVFERLDRDHDGKITAADLDWSDDSPYVRQSRLAERLFRQADTSSNGRVSEAEWQALFKKATRGKDHLTPEDVRDLLFPPPSPPPPSKGPPPGMPTPTVLLFGLLGGEIGSAFEGPSVGRMAPDFDLPTQDGSRHVRLSEYRGHKPVVLIFGNFT